MKKAVVFLLGLIVLVYVAKHYLDKNPLSPPGESSQAKQRLDNVRQKARKIEADDARRAEEYAREPAEK